MSRRNFPWHPPMESLPPPPQLQCQMSPNRPQQKDDSSYVPLWETLSRSTATAKPVERPGSARPRGPSRDQACGEQRVEEDLCEVYLLLYDYARVLQRSAGCVRRLTGDLSFAGLGDCSQTRAAPSPQVIDPFTSLGGSPSPLVVSPEPELEEHFVGTLSPVAEGTLLCVLLGKT